VVRTKQTYVMEPATELADSRSELIAEASEDRDEMMLETSDVIALAALSVAEAMAPAPA
jgi:hypothetical protein